MNEKGPPIRSRPCGERRFRIWIFTVSDLDLVWDWRRRMAQPLHGPGGPSQCDTVRRKDLLVERPSNCCGENVRIPLQIAIRIVGKRPKECTEVVIREVCMHHRDHPI